MQEQSIQFIAILVTIAGLLGWVLKQVISYFIQSSQEKSEYIENLVAQNEKNTIKFVDTINHQRNLDREMQSKHLKAVENLTQELHNTNEVNSKVLAILKKNGS